MTTHQVTRRTFLGTAAALAAPAVLPGSLFGRERGDGTPSQDSLRKIDEAWTARLGCSVEEFKAARTHIVPHPKESWCEAAIVYRHDGACIISLPRSVSSMERAHLRAADPRKVCDPVFLAKAFVTRPAAINNPVRIGVADRNSLKQTCSNVRALNPEDDPALRRMMGRCGELDIARSWLSSFPQQRFGRFQGTDLVAVSGLIPIGEDLAAVRTLTPVEHRGKGHGEAVAGAAAAAAIAEGRVAMWGMFSGQGPAERGESIGFHPYASTIHVQLAEDTF